MLIPGYSVALVEGVTGDWKQDLVGVEEDRLAGGVGGSAGGRLARARRWLLLERG